VSPKTVRIVLHAAVIAVLLAVVTHTRADPDLFGPNHSPRFRIDESALKLGVRALSRLAVDWLRMPGAAKK